MLAKLKQKLTMEERGVSPVIGVILMVAITVILAAVIASFVLGLGDTDDPAPNLAFDTDTTDDDVKVITITSGDSDADVDLISWEGDATVNDDFDDLSAGSTAEIDWGGEGDEAQLIWDDDDTLQTFDIDDS